MKRHGLCKTRNLYGSRSRVETWNALSLSEEEKLMRTLKVSKIWISAFLLAVLAAGCGDPDAGGGNPGSPLTAPKVTFVTPPNGLTLVCPNAAIISATFSKAMNPATINTSTFTLTGPSGAVAGAVSYVAATNTATFTPTTSLAVSTTFTATVTTGVADTFGNNLAANFVSTFTTSGVCSPPPPIGPPLASLCSVGILGASPVVSSTGPTHVTGDVDIFPAASITGFSNTGGPGTITGAFHEADGVAQTAQGDLTVAYNNAAGAPGGAALTADIGGQTLAPGVYKATTTLGITGDLTLNGSSNGVWIFQVGSALTTAAGTTGGIPNSRVILTGGAQSKNVFWQIGSSATLGTQSIFAGNIMAQASITAGTGATLNGRALARTGAVALDSNPVNVPPCP
jgi:ice-binding like protein/Big-like domain-containing protein